MKSDFTCQKKVVLLVTTFTFNIIPGFREEINDKSKLLTNMRGVILGNPAYGVTKKARTALVSTMSLVEYRDERVHVIVIFGISLF